MKARASAQTLAIGKLVLGETSLVELVLRETSSDELVLGKTTWYRIFG